MTGRFKLQGKLIGPSILCSVDRAGTRTDKHNCAYIIHDFQVPTGYAAYLLGEEFPEQYALNLSGYCPEATIAYSVSGLETLSGFDIIEIETDGCINVMYRHSSQDNVLFITNKCNSNCIMCPDSDYNRRKDLGDRYDFLSQMVALMPHDVAHLTITGGEPTLLQWRFISLLEQCRDTLPDTEFLMLSNGRSLCVDEYRQAFLEAVPNHFRLAVPVYSASADVHDAITRAPHGFEQTLIALRHLQTHIEIEIRIVIMSLNYRQLPEIARFIVNELPHTATVSFMGMELLGNAAINKDKLWVEYSSTAEYIERAAHILLNAGIDAKIYNYPLCSLPRRLWSIAVQSISDYKIRYKPECESCAVKKLCGGFFFSTINYSKVVAKPVSGGTSNDSQ